MPCIGREPLNGSEVSYDSFYECETWSLDISIARFILPRLEYLYEQFESNCDTEDSWIKEYKKMKEGLEIIAREDACILVPDSREYKKVHQALDLLRKWFLTLWS